MSYYKKYLKYKKKYLDAKNNIKGGNHKILEGNQNFIIKIYAFRYYDKNKSTIDRNHGNKRIIDISYYKDVVSKNIHLTLNELKQIKSILSSKYDNSTKSYNLDNLTIEEYKLLKEFEFIDEKLYKFDDINNKYIKTIRSRITTLFSKSNDMNNKSLIDIFIRNYDDYYNSFKIKIYKSNKSYEELIESENYKNLESGRVLSKITYDDKYEYEDAREYIEYR